MILAVETSNKEREGVRFRAKEREQSRLNSIRCRSLKFRMIDMALGKCVCAMERTCVTRMVYFY